MGNCAGRTVVSIDGYEDVPVNDQAALEKAVSSQPVSVAICASEAMQFYSSGVIVGEGSCTGLNHGVLAAGYGKVRLPSFSSGLGMRLEHLQLLAWTPPWPVRH